MLKKSIFLLLIILLMLTIVDVSARNFTLKNNGTTTLNIKYLTGATGATASWTLAAGASVVHSVADGTAAIRYWADTGANSPACNTLAEFTLNGSGGLDYYDISLVDGFNVAIQIIPSGGTGNGTKYSCGIAGCTTTSLVTNCPAELKLNGACCSACMIYGSAQYCCTGSYNTPATCPATSYSNYFKTNCPDAYSYAYDDTTSTYTCTGPSYTINFAGAGSTGTSTPVPTTPPASTVTLVNNAIYQMEPACAAGKRLDVSGSGTADGTNVQIWTSNGANAQKWKAVSLGSGYWKFIPQNATTKALDVNGAGSADGTNVIIWADNGTNAQRWKLFDASGGYIRLEPACAVGKALDVSASGSADGTNVQIWTSNGTNAQRWKFISGTAATNTPTPATGSTATPTPASSTATPTTAGGRTLVWSDEFDGSGQPNSANWNYHVGNGYNPGLPGFQGWGNGEWEWYRPENCYLSGGNLVIRADYSTTAYYNVGGRLWYQKSGRITTQGKKSWQYGRLEARIRFPKGQGNWCAFWMMGTSSAGMSYTSSYAPAASYYDVMVNNWASCGEVDIAEHAGGGTAGIANCFWDLRTGVYPWTSGQNANYGNTNVNYGDVNVYKVYALEWTSSRMTWYVDGVQAHVIDTTPATLEEFRKPFYLILNMAIGGTLGGAVDAASFPMYMYVDYVRVYQ